MRLLIPLVVLLAAYHVYAASPRFEEQERSEIVLDTRLDVRAGGVLSVDVKDADVVVDPADDGVARVTVSVRGRDLDWAREVYRRMQFSVRTEGNDILIDAGEADVTREEWRRHRSGAGVLVRVQVPARYDLDVKSADGDIAIGDIVGNTKLWSADGDLVVGSLSGSVIELRTSDGDVSARSLESPNPIRIDTRDGNVIIRRMAGPLRASSGDGDISLDLETPAEIAVRTGDGDITILAPRELNAELEFSGETVHVAGAFTFQGRKSETWARGRVNAGGPLLSASTSDGSVTLTTPH